MKKSPIILTKKHFINGDEIDYLTYEINDYSEFHIVLRVNKNGLLSMRSFLDGWYGKNLIFKGKLKDDKWNNEELELFPNNIPRNISKEETNKVINEILKLAKQHQWNIYIIEHQHEIGNQDIIKKSNIIASIPESSLEIIFKYEEYRPTIIGQLELLMNWMYDPIDKEERLYALYLKEYFGVVDKIFIFDKGYKEVKVPKSKNIEEVWNKLITTDERFKNYKNLLIDIPNNKKEIY